LVDLNTTIFPILGPIGSLINTLKVLVGGVFGVYLIILYLKWREYVVLKKMLTDIRKDLRVIASHQRIEMDPIKDRPLVTFGKYVKHKVKEKKEERAVKRTRKKVKKAKSKNARKKR